MLQNEETGIFIFTNCAGILQELSGPGCCATTAQAGAAETLFLRAGPGCPVCSLELCVAELCRVCTELIAVCT